MRNLAVIPPMMLDVRQRRMRFLNNNGLLEDPVAVSKEQNHLGRWTEQEKQIFKEKYLQHPKNFSLIATFLPRKVRIFFLIHLVHVKILFYIFQCMQKLGCF